MKLIRSVFAFTLFGALATAPMLAGDVKIIANPSVTQTEVSADDLKEIFLQNKNSIGSAHVTPVLHKGGPAEDEFCQKYVGKPDATLQTYYRSLIFTGKAVMPKAFATDEEVIEYVSKNKGAVGFVSASAKVDGVVVLHVK